MFFRMVMWPINSEIYFLTITRAFYLPWDMRTLWSQKCNYFTYHCEFSWKKNLKHRKNDWKRIQAFFVRRSNSVICWKSTQFPENWSWHSSFDRVGRRWEFQQISELWIRRIRVDYLHAKCQKRLRVLEKAKKNEEDIIHIYVAVCNSKGISANFE